MFDVPASVRATWPSPNFEDPVTRGPALIVNVVLWIILAIMVVVLRSYTRLRITNSFGPDDILIVISMVSWIGSL